jgi:hypothetical protein
MEDTSKFKGIKNDLKNEIYSYLSFDDFQKLFSLSKSYKTYMTKDNYLNIKFLFLLFLLKNNKINLKDSSEFYLFLARKMTNFKDLINNYLNVSPTIIPVLGYKSEGGVFSEGYHYNNLNVLKKYKFYSSKPNEGNFNVFSSLIPEFCTDYYRDRLKVTKKSEISLKLMKNPYPINTNFSISTFKDLINQSRYSRYKVDNEYQVDAFDAYQNSEMKIVDDSYILEKFSSNYYFSCDHIYLNNIGNFTCPGKTLVIFIHDDKELNEADLKLLNETKILVDNEILNTYIKNNNHLQVLNSSMNSIQKIVYYEFDTIIQRNKKMNLKLVLWTQIPTHTEYLVDLQPYIHIGKYFITKFIDSHPHHIDKNIDFSKTLFFGNIFKMLKED